MSAGVVEDPFDVPVRAAFHMAAQRRAVAVDRHPHRPPHMLLQWLDALKGRVMGPEDLNQLIRGRLHELGAWARAAGEAVHGVGKVGKVGTGLRGLESEPGRTRRGAPVVWNEQPRSHDGSCLPDLRNIVTYLW